MKLRTKSPSRQNVVWTCLLISGIVVYSFCVFKLGGDVHYWAFLRPDRMRFFLPISVLVGFLCYELRWDGIVREERRELSDDADGLTFAPTEEEKATLKQASADAETAESSDVSPVDIMSERTEPTSPAVSASGEREPEPGESEYALARALPHRAIPDYANDGDYLDLLGKAAAQGYPRALAKFGEYAMRRHAWVEAYFWMWLARRAGMRNLNMMLRDIRLHWAKAGYPNQSSNIHKLFSEAQGSIGRALINIDSGRSVTAARDYLREHHPELLKDSATASAFIVS